MVRLSEFGNHHRGRQLILAVLKALSDSSGITQVLACFGQLFRESFVEPSNQLSWKHPFFFFALIFHQWFSPSWSPEGTPVTANRPYELRLSHYDSVFAQRTSSRNSTWIRSWDPSHVFSCQLGQANKWPKMLFFGPGCTELRLQASGKINEKSSTQVSKCACELLGWTVHPFQASYHRRNLSDHTMPGKPVSWKQGKVLEHHISANIWKPVLQQSSDSRIKKKTH